MEDLIYLLYIIKLYFIFKMRTSIIIFILLIIYTNMYFSEIVLLLRFFEVPFYLDATCTKHNPHSVTMPP